ncbi:MAG TPA: hypothetical protein DDZ51_01195 [Planctomycetaceae bacterium]|nr:hypothetical protein [Planctomycetaceae bacterium]
MMQKQENPEELFSDIEKYHGQLLEIAAELPPINAKDLIHNLLAAAVPLMAEMRQRYPAVIAAFDAERASIAKNIEIVEQNTAKAKEVLASALPPEEALKRMVPVAMALPDSAVSQFSEELFSRYVVNPTSAVADDFHGNAWQDWAIGS